MVPVNELIKGFFDSYSIVFKSYIANSRLLIDYLHSFFDSTFNIFLYLTIAFTSIYLILSLFVAVSRKKNNEKEFIESKAPFVTVQIPTKNEIIALRCAKKCIDFDYPKDKYEILIGDDSTETSVSEEIGRFAAQHPLIKVVKRTDNIGFKPGNLNNMLKHSKGEILVIFDSDFTPEKDFLKRIIAPFIHDPSISAVQAKWNFNNFGQNMVSMLASTIVYVFHNSVLSFMDLFGAGSLCGSAEAIKKKDLVDLGSWKSGSLTEDIEYALRLFKNNKKIVYLKGLQCYSDVPFTPVDLYKQQMRWAYGVVSSYKAHLKSFLFSSSVPFSRKFMGLFPGFGYLMPILMLILFITGALSFATNAPAPLDIPKFFSDMAFNVVLTSGILVASFISLYKENKIKHLFKTFVASFSIGLITAYYVNKGIFKSIFNRPMQWHLLNKNTDYSDA